MAEAATDSDSESVLYSGGEESSGASGSSVVECSGEEGCMPLELLWAGIEEGGN